MTEILWNQQSPYPILSILQGLPFLGLIFMLLIGRRRSAPYFAIAIACLELLVAVDLYRLFDSSQSAMQFGEHFGIVGAFAYHAVADGLTVAFVLLTAILSLILVIYVPARRLASQNQVLALLFAVESILMSLLVTVDLLWFVLLSALQFVPIAYLIWRWTSSPEKNLALSRFLQFMSAGLILLLGGVLMLGYHHASVMGYWSFDLFDLANAKVGTETRSIVFFLLFYGLAIRTPLFPLHGWLPIIAHRGSIALAPVFLLGIKTGVYGILRFVFPLVPEAILEWHRYVVAFAVAGVFYAALLAMLQWNVRRLLAFAVISHTSILIIGLFSLEHEALQGTVILAANYGLAIAGMLVMVGLVHRRTRTTRMDKLGGLFDHIPIIGITFLIAGLAIVGMPGTPGFDGIHLMLEASVMHFGALVTIAAALGNVAAAGFLLMAFQRVFLSTSKESNPLQIERTTKMEWLLAGLILLTLLGLGFFTETWLELIDKSLAGISVNFDTVAAHD
ncbi:MAG: NADH-quinone oxidoreductase subunit L [Thiothrix sp.]|nr:MAG: NADH-quinone oxidoreductase subunit L [Thiothrix sp.]